MLYSSSRWRVTDEGEGPRQAHLLTSAGACLSFSSARVRQDRGKAVERHQPAEGSVPDSTRRNSAPKTLMARRGGWWLLPVLALLFDLVVGGWFVTFGNGAFLSDKNQIFPFFFDAQADALLKGELNVPCDVIGVEAYIVNEKCYGYFGITPSLFRIPLNLAWPGYRGQWAPLSMFAATLVFLFVAFRLIDKVRSALFANCPQDFQFHFLSAVYLLALGLGSTSIFLLSRPVMYHEAIVWSVSLALAAMSLLFDYVVSGSVRWLFCAGVLAMLSVNTRPTGGAAAIGACGLIPLLALLLEWRRLSGSASLSVKMRDALIGAGLATLSLGVYLAVVHGKFGRFEVMPVRYNAVYTPERLARIDGSMLHLGNIRWNLRNYFGFTVFPFKQGWSQVAKVMREDPGAKVDGIEPYMSITVSMSALLILAIMGTLGSSRTKHFRWGFDALCACALFGPVVMLTFAYLSYRYFHEYLLWFAIAGAAGIPAIATRLKAKGFLIPLVTLAVIVNAFLNTEMAILYQMNNTNVGRAISDVSERVHRWKEVVRTVFSAP